ncbi:hypothetical protein D6D06_00437 [Aureobasidium pullulans]|nr:hypothetical protein D6D06_00437 [Aureobasidium pullulans]THX90154.1 hypothetical protein D6D05_00743 [Aureobasidium pullulans]
MSADLPQFTGRNNNTQAALLVPTTITLTLGLVLYGVRIRARRSSPLVWIDGMITAALWTSYSPPSAVTMVWVDIRHL